jgi:hypothetical protein
MEEGCVRQQERPAEGPRQVRRHSHEGILQERRRQHGRQDGQEILRADRSPADGQERDHEGAGLDVAPAQFIEAHEAREARREELKLKKAADGSIEIDWDDEQEQLYQWVMNAANADAMQLPVPKDE